jgi:hypothetical protein
MKTRYLTIAAVLAVAACSDPAPNTSEEARLRNNLPASCTMEQIAACPAMDVKGCAPGEEPVIDYDADCCGHFSCQPVCSSAQQRSCDMSPAPTCPPRHKLWIGTAVEDCCPAYRCQPDPNQCNPMTETCACDSTNAACTLALPYCGPNVMPIVVGQTNGCCPIYQCPCDPMKATDANGNVMTDPATGFVPNPSCGCTFPNCRAGEQVVCAGADRCGGPCECKPAHGTCRSDTECSPDARCDLSTCRLPPSTAALVAPPQTCDAAKCGPKPALPSEICPDGSVAGPTDRCLLQADGSCGWEIRRCPNTMPPPDCYGICVPNIQRGCRADAECPSGQVCKVACTGWSCTAGGTPTNTTDPATGAMTSLVAPRMCACDLNDPSCMCDAAGNCRGQTCEGMCTRPPGPVCDPGRLVACPMTTQACANGAQPVQTGVNPDTCCPIYQCPVCSRPATGATDLVAPTNCPTPRCACAKATGTDPMTCCPSYECRPVNADGTCA